MTGILRSLIVLLFLLGAVAVRARPQVHEHIYRTLHQHGVVNLIVIPRTNNLTRLAAKSVPTAEEGRGARITELVRSLQTSAGKELRPITKLLAKEADISPEPQFAYSTAYWISSQVFIANASQGLLRKLLEEPSIAEVRQEEILPMASSLDAEPVNTEKYYLTWSCKKIGATTLWEQGITGENITVATIDSGVRVTHEAVRDTFVGSYGWYDPEGKMTTPYDLTGHGTHVMGSVVGANGVGVAPKAKWMSCRGCSSATSCRESSLLACAQFVLCPTDPSGRNKNCSRAPHVVNNSWGTNHGAADFSRVIAMWRAAGIIPVFAAGNSGSSTTCSTVVSPADSSAVIAVGATSVEDALLPQSASGPSLLGFTKPDIAAPGVDIYSAWWTRDNVYAIASGTSMAAPHVTGAVALLLSAQPELTYEQIWTALTVSTAQDQNLITSTAPHGRCGNVSSFTFPNNVVGYGRLDVRQAMASLRSGENQKVDMSSC